MGTLRESTLLGLGVGTATVETHCGAGVGVAVGVREGTGVRVGATVTTAVANGAAMLDSATAVDGAGVCIAEKTDVAGSVGSGAAPVSGRGVGEAAAATAVGMKVGLSAARGAPNCPEG
ncbi:MAG: hypothetical protein Fur0021_19070 [Candidatus Promineifilaceae bacterium]